MLGHLWDGLVLMLNWGSLLAVLAGLVAGIVVGALPGLTATMAIAILAPFTFFMRPEIGIPFLLAALAVKPFMAFMQKFKRHLHKVEVVAGALLVITGILIFTNSLGQLSYYILDLFPWLAKIG